MGVLKTLRNCEVLSNNLTLKQLKLLVKYSELIPLQRGEIALLSQKKGKYFYIVQQGKLAFYIKNELKRFLHIGDIFGEIGALTQRYRLGTIRAQDYSKIIAFHRDIIFSDKYLPMEIRFKILWALSENALSYYYQCDEEAISSIVEQGESITTEFKANFRGKIYACILRTIAAFMNAEGGTILIGVHDNLNISGIDITSKELDHFQQKLFNDIRNHLAKSLVSLVKVNRVHFRTKILIRIDVEPSQSAVFYKNKQNGKYEEHFFVRSGSTNTCMTNPSEVLRHLRIRA